MRLSPQQVSEIKASVKNFMQQEEHEIFLYGSRTQDTLRGGDIDLLVITTAKGVEIFNSVNLDLLVYLKKQSAIGQRRIDIKAATTQDLESSPFLAAIRPELVAL